MSYKEEIVIKESLPFYKHRSSDRDIGKPALYRRRSSREVSKDKEKWEEV